MHWHVSSVVLTESSMPWGGGGKGELVLGQKFKMADEIQPSDWLIIKPVCVWTIIQDGRWKITGQAWIKWINLIGQYSDLNFFWCGAKFLWSIVTINSDVIYYPYEV